MTAFAASSVPRPTLSPSCFQRAVGGAGVERHRPADQLRAEAAEHDVGVGVRGLLVAAQVTRGPGIRAGRLRAVAERAGAVDPGQRAAAGADRQHLDRREADRVAVLDEPLLRDPLLALVDERDVGARAAHVEADRVRVAAQHRDVAARDRARGDARRGEPDGQLLGRLRRHHAAARVQQQDVAVVAALLEPRLEPLHVAADERREHGVRDRRREALVLEDLGQDVARGGDADARQLLLEDLAHALLVLRVGVRVDEADGDGLDAALAQDRGDAARALLVDGLEHLAVVPHPLAHLEAVAAADVRRRDVLVGVPEVFLRAAADLDHVAEALGRDHGRAREVARDQRVRGHGRAVREDDRRRAGRRSAAPRTPSITASIGSAGVDGHLRHRDHAGVLVEHADVGERAADVAGHAQPRHDCPRIAGIRGTTTARRSRAGGPVPARG